MIIQVEDRVKVYTERELRKLPWGDMGIDIVIESTGLFPARQKAALQLSASAKKVTINTLAKGEDITVYMDVNWEKHDPAKHQVICNASCHQRLGPGRQGVV